MSYHCAYLKENEIKVTMAPGGSGLSSVAHDETLIGKGTNKNPLGVDTTIIAKKSDIPAPITEENVRDWGFTKNTGNYNKPQTGIPKTDLASEVQTSLEKANTALQEHQDITGKVDKIEGKGLSTNDYTNEEKEKLSGLENYDDTELRTLIDGKQDIIDDLETIRDGASKGATAIQEIPSEYVTETELNAYHDNTKVDKEEGKGLSTNDYTDEEKEKLSQLENYDDTQVKSDINTINGKIPTQATNNNQLADKDFVNSSLNSITAFYITKNVDGDQFNSKAELDSSTIFYSGGEVRVPTRNDYCIVLEDETKDNSTTRYIYQNNQWEFQYVVNETPLTSEQVKAINSGITPELVAKLQDIDLTEYVKNTDYASQTKGGTVRTSSNFNIYSNGQVYCGTRTFSQYESDGNGNFISKGTLENVILGKELTNKTYVDTGLSNKADKILVVENANETELQPNKYYKWGEVASLNLTLGTPIDGIVNEYMFEFISGATATTLTLPDTIKFETIPNIEANKKYQISIVNNIALIVGV